MPRPELTKHQQEIFDDLQKLDRDGQEYYSYGYLRGSVKALLDGECDQAALGRRFADIEAARDAAPPLPDRHGTGAGVRQWR